MDILNVVLRALHILGGIFWVGGAVMMNAFVLPSVNATRPESGKFMQHLASQSGMRVWMLIASTVTVICGLVMFSPATGQLNGETLRSARGMTLSVGALLALAAYLEGFIVISPTVGRLGALGREIAASGKAPTPEQAQAMQSMQARIGRAGVRGTAMLVLAALAMAVARFV